MAPRTVRALRTYDRPDLSSLGRRLRTRDAAAKVRTPVAEYSAVNHVAEIEGGRLVVYHEHEGLDAGKVYDGRGQADRDEQSATFRRMNDAARRFWGR